MRNVLIISPFFPPSALAGVHRARHLATQLPRCGWEPRVVSVMPRYYEGRLDEALARSIPDTVEVIRVPALDGRVARAFGVGDLGLRAYCELRSATKRAIERRRPDVLFVTVSPYYPALFAAELAHRFELPLVVDYQDPWLPATALVESPDWKRRLAYALGRRLEPRVLRHATHITSVSEGTNELLMRRYPQIPSSAFTALPIGVDTADFVGADSAPRRRDAGRPNAPIDLVYVGTVWDGALAAIRVVFRAVNALRQSRPEVYRRLRIHFVGTTYAAESSSEGRVMPLARQEGVDDRVTEHASRVPYTEALAVMRNADVLLAVGSSDVHYTASKIFPYLLSGTPIIGLFHERSSVLDVVRRTGGARIVAFSAAAPVDTKVGAVERLLVAAVSDPESIPARSMEAMESFTAAAIAERFAAVFDNAVRSRQTALSASRVPA